jgi:hypothetical protein
LRESAVNVWAGGVGIFVEIKPHPSKYELLVLDVNQLGQQILICVEGNEYARIR